MAAELPAELREAAGQAANACNWLGRDEAARLHTTGNCQCYGCLRWPNLTDEMREAFRASQDPALSVVAPLLAECAGALVVARDAAPEFVYAAATTALARLTALGVRP